MGDSCGTAAVLLTGRGGAGGVPAWPQVKPGRASQSSSHVAVVFSATWAGCEGLGQGPLVFLALVGITAGEATQAVGFDVGRVQRRGIGQSRAGTWPGQPVSSV